MASNCKHPDRPERSNGMCGSCYNKYLYDKMPEDRKQEIISRRKARWAERYASRNTPEYALKQRSRTLMHRYGISENDYQQMLNEQHGVCYLCKQPQRGSKKMYVDHNHTTGKVRKLLCSRCNTFVGFVETNPHLLAALELYLRENS